MPIRAAQLREKEDYQKLILERLRDDNGFIIRPSNKYHSGLAMDPELLLGFLDTTQHDTMDELRRIYKDHTNDIILDRINTEINHASRGLIDVIKHGVEFDSGIQLNLMYRKPDSTINTEAVKNYSKNIFSVMEEVWHNDNERIDLVLFLNGLAIFAVELKCNTSGQDYNDAIKQYKERRDFNSRLFKKHVGVLAAFAMDLNEVYFTTELRGRDTFFNPFNGGGNDYGKGNRHNENGNVSYMWEWLWTKDQILFLIERFIYIKTKTYEDPDTNTVIKSKELIFPRFHQLRAVQRVMNDVIINHSKYNYLIEHSAGSGKTETISWLSHILATVHDKDNKNIFDTVLVITDRIVVDRQLQEAILGIEHKLGQVEVMDDSCDSADLALALRGNTKIIVTTIHKFFYILDSNILGNLRDKKFAVLIDEAHSSTEGSYMQSVTTVLTNETNNDVNYDDDSDDETEEDKILNEIRRSGKQSNVSMVAFTATPKADTLELFGTLNSAGKKEAFDLYPMKQAIEEGYILNVLDNYVTWRTYCRINKTIKDDPELESVAAKKKMLQLIDLDETNIAQKVEIIVEHFLSNVKECLGGKAKAMVITSSRKAAVKYKQKFEEYIQEKGYTDVKGLVAFSGKVRIDNEEYTEVRMNNEISEEKLRHEFDRSCYQFLFVANKYQTGFDQPKLVAMYVDKRLKGISAVQTLSRLNRTYRPYDKTTFVLDFKNDYDDIVAAFAPYYKNTISCESILPYDIHALAKELGKYEFLNQDDIDKFNEYLYLKDRSSDDKQHMWSLLDNALQRVMKHPKKEQLEIKITMRRFIKGYRFLIQATAYENTWLHGVFNFLIYLVKELNPEDGGNNFDIADKISVTGFRQKKIKEHIGGMITAHPEVKVGKPMPAAVEERQKKLLSKIIEEINASYGTKFEAKITTQSAFQIRDLLLDDSLAMDRLTKSAKINSPEEFKFTYDECVQNALVEGLERNAEELNSNRDFYSLILKEKDIFTKIVDVFRDEVYEQLKSNINY